MSGETRKPTTGSILRFSAPPGSKSTVDEKALAAYAKARDAFGEAQQGLVDAERKARTASLRVAGATLATEAKAVAKSRVAVPAVRGFQAPQLTSEAAGALAPWALGSDGALSLGEGSITTRRAVIKSIPLDPNRFGWYTDAWYYLTGDGQLGDLWTFQDVAQFRLGGLVHAKNWSADNSDRIYCYAESGLWYTYVPEESGKLLWAADANRYYDSACRRVNNEYGNSNATIRQETYSVGGFKGPDNQFFGRGWQRMASDIYRGSGDALGTNGTPGNFGPQQLHPGYLWLYGYPAGRVTKGVPVDILIGVRVELEATLDDVGVQFWQGSGWRLNRLWIQVDSDA